MGRALVDAIYKNGLISIVFFVWVMALVTWVVVYTFTATPDIPINTAGLVGTILGLPAVAVGLWQWRHRKDKEGEQ